MSRDPSEPILLAGGSASGYPDHMVVTGELFAQIMRWRMYAIAFTYRAEAQLDACVAWLRTHGADHVLQGELERASCRA